MNRIIYLNNSNSVFMFHKYKMKYYLNGQEVIDYGNDFKTMQSQVIKNPHRYSCFTYEDFRPTTEQVDRLKEVNALPLDPMFKRNTLEDIALYVESNVMVNKAAELSSLSIKATADTKVWLVNLLKPDVKLLRDEVRYGGIPMFGTVIASDQDAKVSVMGYILYGLLQSNINPNATKPWLDSKTYNWKAKNNDFVTLTYAQLIEMAKTLITHEEGCFAAEKLVLDQLLALSVAELTRFRQLAKYNRTGNIVDQEFTCNELRPIWDNCYSEVLKYLNIKNS